jgi:hypothetical protein
VYLRARVIGKTQEENRWREGEREKNRDLGIGEDKRQDTGQSILSNVPCKKKALSYKNGKWGPQIQLIRCQVDSTFKNEVIITKVHLTELKCKRQVVITLVHNHTIKCWVIYHCNFSHTLTLRTEILDPTLKKMDPTSVSL